MGVEKRLVKCLAAEAGRTENNSTFILRSTPFNCSAIHGAYTSDTDRNFLTTLLSHG